MLKLPYRYQDLQESFLETSVGGENVIGSSGANFLDPFLEDAVVPEIDGYSENNVSWRENKVKAWTFYCDSVSEEGITSYDVFDDKCNYFHHPSNIYNAGDGSKWNPFKNLQNALFTLHRLRVCLEKNICCSGRQRYFQIKVKGQINYNINGFCWGGPGGSDAGGETSSIPIIVTPWDRSEIEFPMNIDLPSLIFENAKIHSSFSIGSRDLWFYKCEISRDEHFILSEVRSHSDFVFIKTKIKNCDFGVDWWDFEDSFDAVYTAIECEFEDFYVGFHARGVSGKTLIYSCKFKYNTFEGERTYEVGLTGALIHSYMGPFTTNSKVYNSTIIFENCSGGNGVYLKWSYGLINPASSGSLFWNVNIVVNWDGEGKDHNYNCYVFCGSGGSIFRDCKVQFNISGVTCREDGTGYCIAVGYYDNQDALYRNCSSNDICMICPNDTAQCPQSDKTK